MSINAASLFDEYQQKMKRLKKASYKLNYENMIIGHKDTIMTIADELNGADNKEDTAKQIGKEFAESVYDCFARGSRLSSMKKSDLSFFMIYYVFPAFLDVAGENASLLCDSIRDAWNAKFGMNIDYTDYETLLGGFKDKLFGLF